MTLARHRDIVPPAATHAAAGTWRIIARPWGQPEVDITMLRGKPVVVGEFSFGDPFGPLAMTLEFPQVTIFDRRGVGDLHWMRKGVDVDVIWDGDLPEAFRVAPAAPGDDRPPQWRWEGYQTTYGTSSSGGTTVQLKGAGLQLDRYLAKPEYPARPLPYEWAIARCFVGKPALRLMPLRVVWPSWWTRTFDPPTGVPSYLMPAGVSKGENWTGLLTRSTGTWDPTLTSYVQSLLAAMYDERGRWTIDLDAGRQPVLFHRPYVMRADASVVVIDVVEHGKDVELSEDWENSITTAFGQGTSLSGVSFSGMQISGDGSETVYRPLASLRQVWPESQDNGWYDPSVMPLEVFLQLQPGLSQDDAATVARAHLRRFAEPGSTGTVTLDSDPVVDGVRVPRGLVRAGMTVWLPRVGGTGLLAHVTGSSTNPATGKVTLQIDSKFRDQLTVEEVALRGRDALSVARMLVAGQYQPPVSDQMLPWSYEGGSGIIPSNETYSALALFSSMPATVAFPWTEWTTTHPPKDPKWRSSYLRIGPAQGDADANWFVQKTASGTAFGVPITMAQAGTIRQTLMAAYDLDGNVLPVSFHLSFYYVGGVNVLSMPRIPVEQKTLFPPYTTGQHYPFVRDGWEAFKIDGTKNDPNTPQPTESVGLIKAFGTYYEKAGHWPGSYAEGDAPTGLLLDETPWSFDTTNTADAYWDPYRAERNLTNPKAGKIYAMLYCDAQLTQEVFFLGRLFRAEPGTGGS